MEELKKILEEIDQEIEKERTMCEGIEDTPGWRLYEKTMQMAKHIIHKHLSRENDPEITRSSRDSICGECSRRKWYQIGYKDGKNDGWIPVEGKMPEGKALVCDKYGEMMIGYICGSANGGYDCEGDGYEMFNVLAWQPLPEPYRPERTRP